MLSVMMVLVSVFTFAIDPSNSQLVVLNTNTTGVFKVIYHQPGQNSVAFKVYNNKVKSYLQTISDLQMVLSVH
jgi:hypothetical protein